MAMSIAGKFRRWMRAGACLLAVLSTLSVVARAVPPGPPPVTTGSVVTVPANNGWGQVYKVLFYQGNVLALDAGNDALYQLAPGATSWTTLVPSKTGILGGGFNAQGMTIDAVGNLYITVAYSQSVNSTALFWRVPYQNGTWNVTASDGWGSNLVDANTGNSLDTSGELGSSYTVEAFFQNSSKMDGSGTLYFWTTSNGLWSAPVDKTGNASQSSVNATQILSGTKAGQSKIAVDAAGNIYFVEYHATTNSARDTGIWFIPAAAADPNTGGGLVGVGPPLVRIDVGQANSSAPIVYSGVTLDANGDLYLTSEQNANYNETVGGTWEIPNVCGPTGVNASNVTQCLNWNNTVMLAPVGGNQPLAIDSRGYLWIPSYQSSFPPSNTNGPYPGVDGNPGIFGLVVWSPGVLNLNHVPAGPSPTGAPGTAGILYYSFNSTVTPGGFQFSSSVPGNASVFGTTQTNPLPPTSSTGTPPAPCNAPATPGPYATYSAQSWCELWVTMDPTAPGAVSAELTLLDSTLTPVSGSTVYVNGTGQGPGVALLNNPGLAWLASSTALSTPAQVASDAFGDTWVADPGKRAVLYFAAGSSLANGQSIGTNLTAPTGVAVDGAGDVYIGDSGKVYEIPCVTNSSTQSTCAYGTQTTIATGLGATLNLAVDGSGNVYVADSQKGQVVKIPSPAQSNLINSTNELGASASSYPAVGFGLTAPSAVAVDTFGNVYIADSGNLYEEIAAPFNGQTAIIEGTLGDVTGLAVDASGSVIVAQNGGLLRIPSLGGTLSANSAGPLDNSVDVPSNATDSVAAVSITSPTGVAMDQQGNVYVSDTTNGPNLYQLNVIDGFVQFGVGLVPEQLTVQDVSLVNIGNSSSTPLTLLANQVSFTGGTTTEDGYFSLATQGTGTLCDPTGVESVIPGGSCTLPVGFTPPAPPPGNTGSINYSGVNISVPTNAVNVAGGTVAAGLQGTALAGLEPTQITAQANLTSSSYPGAGSIVVTITPECSTTCYPNAIPYGTVTLTLTNAANQQSTVQTLTVTSGGTGGAALTYSFSETGLPGGTYTITAAYSGNITQLMQPSTLPTVPPATFTVNTTAPAITLAFSSPPAANTNLQVVNGVTYVATGQKVSLTATVTSALGTPTGTVTIMNGNQAVGTATYGQGGSWTFAAGSLPVGTYNLTAAYSGDQNFSSVTSSPAVTFKDIQPSVLLSANPATVTTKAGTPVQTTITIQSLVGFAAPTGANITCEVAPQDTVPYYAECTFSNPQPAIVGCAPGTGAGIVPCQVVTQSSVLTLSSNIPVNIPPTASNVPLNGPHSSPLLPAGVFGLGLLGLALRRRAIVNRYLLNSVCCILFLAGAVMGMTSCTNSSYSKPPKVPTYTTPSGSYNVSIVVSNPATGAVESLPFTVGVTIQ